MFDELLQIHWVSVILQVLNGAARSDLRSQTALPSGSGDRNEMNGVLTRLRFFFVFCDTIDILSEF